ncbi:MAG: MFS transporter [Pseudonocardia sp.]|nr:MFS transporter [Pseudonocardia sp.]
MTVNEPTTDERSRGGPGMGPLETKHSRSAAFRNVSDGDAAERLTRTHWHIAAALGLGWMLDGIVIALYALIVPYLLEDFGISLNSLTLAVTITGVLAAFAAYFWPWLADRIGRRTAFIINVAFSALFLVLIVVSQNWLFFIVFYTLMRVTIAGEWAVGSLLTVETWPAKHRAKVLSGARSLYGYGVVIAGLTGTYIIAPHGWRWAFLVPAAIGLLAIYARLLCPESPAWVRNRDRIAAEADDTPAAATWAERARKASVGQLFETDQRKRTVVALFVAATATMSWYTLGYWAPFYLKETHGWSTGEYSTWYIWWGVAGAFGYYLMGWIADRWSRFRAMLTGNLIFIATIIPWALATESWQLWVFGLASNFGLIGVWGTVLTYTAELYPTRMRGVGMGLTWMVAGFLGVLVPYGALWVRNVTGSFTVAFLIIPLLLVIQLVGLFVARMDYAGKRLDTIAT